MSQNLGFPLTGPWNVQAPFCSSPETSYRVKVTASPPYTAWALVPEVRFTKNNIPIDVANMGSNKLYSKTTAFREYAFSIRMHPYAITLLQYGAADPNYTTPAGTGAESLTFLIKYLQALGSSAMTAHFLFFLGCKCNMLEMAVSNRDIVTATMDWMLGEISVPDATANGGLTTPTIPTNASITSQPWSNVEAPAKNMVINSISYANKNFRHRWNNNLVADDYVSSGLLDSLVFGNRRMDGSFITPVGQDLLQETKEHDAPQTGVTAKYTFKTAVAVITMTNFYIRGSNPVLSAENNETWHNEFSFESTDSTLGAT